MELSSCSCLLPPVSHSGHFTPTVATLPTTLTEHSSSSTSDLLTTQTRQALSSSHLLAASSLCSAFSGLLTTSQSFPLSLVKLCSPTLDSSTWTRPGSSATLILSSTTTRWWPGTALVTTKRPQLLLSATFPISENSTAKSSGAILKDLWHAFWSSKPWVTDHSTTSN